MEIFIVILQTLLLAFVVYFVWDSKKKDRVQESETLLTFNQTLSNVLSFIVDENKKFYETIEKIQIKYFDSLDKGIQKSNLLLEKNNKEFLKVFAQVFKKEIPSGEVHAIEANTFENSIEHANEPEEILLSDMPRVPIVEGVNIKFEDEKETYPMNIDSIDNYKQEAINPIEK